ncbi:hypothetical protein K7957_05175 [Sphingomonas yunnanensis]|uniref:hypothetical protein n=1 Tax=Sphingomonas yunnanensis TaxID=310400 RepID=UPI001CA63C2B|nr:hypothetical protein [Sphingomonas yunnanensis]MBY9062321.1 hypothetical protein [Sphingomonas yunnanensis]
MRFSPLPAASSGFVVTDEVPGIVASPERVAAWMELASAGDRFVYATRATLPLRSPGATAMRQLSDRGLVILVRPRCAADPTVFNYTAIRTKAPTSLEKPKRERLVARVIDAEAAVVDALLPVLERAASFGRPCPTDKQLASKAGLRPDEVEPALAALVAANLIRIHQAPRPTLRRVTIVASGAQTGLAA